MTTSFDRLLSGSLLASSASVRNAFPARASTIHVRAEADHVEGQFGSKRARSSRANKGASSTGKLSRLAEKRAFTKQRSGRSGPGNDLFDLRQRAAVKVHYFNHGKVGVSGGGGGMNAHTRYLAREVAGRDEGQSEPHEASLENEIDTPEAKARTHSQYLSRGERGLSVFYDSENERIDGAARAEAWARSDKRHFRIILSPEEGERLKDLTAYTREVMARAETQLGTKLQWLAVDHHDTAHAHTHIILRGRRANGQDLVIPKDFIQHGFRNIAREVATEWLGRRTPNQEREALDREARRHALTRLDRIIDYQLPEDLTIRVSRLQSLNGDAHVTRALKSRAKELERLGLASEVRRGVLRFEPDWQERLRALEMHIDIRRSLMAERQLQQRLERERLAKSLSRGLGR